MKSYRNMPDPDVCKTRHVIEGYYNCAVGKDDVKLCPYALPFGYGYFCRHPGCSNFERTESNGYCERSIANS